MTVTIQQAFALALQHHQAGRLAEAEAFYRQVLAAQPNHPDALHLLGVVALQTGRHDLAVEWIRQGLVFHPNNFAAHFQLGGVYRSMGRLDEAVASFRRTLQLKPDFAEAHNSLGTGLADQGRLDEAVTVFRRALQLKPDYPEAQNNLGIALAKQGQFDDAVAAYHHALKLRPNVPETYHYLGIAHRARERLDEAVAAHRRAVELKPDYLEAWLHLGNLLAERGQPDEAVAAYRRALQLKPDSAEAQYNLGTALTLLGRLDEAVTAHRRTLELKPDHAEAWNNLGASLRDQGELAQACAAFRQAASLKPSDATFLSNLIFTMHFYRAGDGGSIHDEQARWNRLYGEPLRPSWQPNRNDPDPRRRLKIGYVSPDFYFHSVSYFFAPLLEAHDRRLFEIYCYANVQRPDAVTDRLRKSADVWRDVHAFSDVQLADCVRADGIDILIDLALHTTGNRLLVFARKPAPVQVAWLGHPGSTGLSAIDYRITDVFLEPEDSAWSESVETPIRLSETWCCFAPLEEYPERAALPALQSGRVTFGCLNNFCKLNEAVLRLWVTALQAVEGSRLVLRCPTGATQTRLREWFEAQGIAADRLDLVPRTAGRAEFLRLFDRIDIALDPFPYNGGTTTFEALWMGLPVVSLAGRTAVSRVGLSALTNVGLPELAAHSEDDYVRIAVALAGDVRRLTDLRQTLRSRMQASPLTDAPRFARNMEAAYRTLWRHWCAQEKGG